MSTLNRTISVYAKTIQVELRTVEKNMIRVNNARVSVRVAANCFVCVVHRKETIDCALLC